MSPVPGQAPRTRAELAAIIDHTLLRPGATRAQVEALCAEARTPEAAVGVANENGGGQLVVAGHAEAVARLVAQVKAIRGRAIVLNVSAPFHCALMQPAAERVAAALEHVTVRALEVPVIANVDAEPNLDPARVKDLLVRQITGRVRWEASMRKAVHMGVTRCLELGHGKVLSGLIKRIDPALPTQTIGFPDEIDVLKVGAK